MTVCTPSSAALRLDAPRQVSTRLRLREFSWHDVDDLVRMHQDPRVRAQLVDDAPLDNAQAVHRFINSLHAFYRQHEGTGIWCAERAVPPDASTVLEARQAHAQGDIGDAWLALVEAPQWRFCGWFSLVHLDDAPHELEIGARLTADAWGGALAIEGGEWLLHQAFAGLGRHQVHGHCSPSNRSAAHCLRALGFGAAGLAAYNGVQAARFTIAQGHWVRWSALPRRERQRAVLRPVAEDRQPPVAASPPAGHGG
ncbi:MAG: GNAT family N-acetyltransferase [Burkholderiales bacterium]|nr:GNAT family N-acetyltransferase [Burkholderiales bacterium]